MSSPLALPETVLKAIITSAAAVNHPLNVGTTLALMNNLVKDTTYEEHFTKLKVVRRMKTSNPCKPLIGTGWLRGFLKRNPDIQSKVGKKFAANRASHCHYTAFDKMYNQVEYTLIKSGNAVLYEHPVHMDMEGNIVNNKSHAFGHPVTN